MDGLDIACLIFGWSPISRDWDRMLSRKERTIHRLTLELQRFSTGVAGTRASLGEQVNGALLQADHPPARNVCVPALHGDKPDSIPQAIAEIWPAANAVITSLPIQTGDLIIISLPRTSGAILELHARPVMALCSQLLPRPGGHLATRRLVTWLHFFLNGQYRFVNHLRHDIVVAPYLPFPN